MGQTLKHDLNIASTKDDSRKPLRALRGVQLSTFFQSFHVVSLDMGEQHQTSVYCVFTR